MIDQPRAAPHRASGLFSHGRAIRPPPHGTVAWDEDLGPPGLVEGGEDGAWVDRVPLPMDRALLERGRSRFEITCAACHGLLGDGDTEVARKMKLVAPPSLLADPIRSFPPGRVYAVVRHGYGLMPSYARQLDLRDRWAVVAYLRALQLSQSTPLAELPPELRRRAEEALR
jgi:mono/diheme cytochrome c family protein